MTFLDHSPDDKRRVGGMRLLLYSLYKAAHKKLKKHYVKASRRLKSVMRDLVS